MLKEILLALEKNAKLNPVNLADIFNAHEDDMAEIVEDCEMKNIISGYHTIINWENTNCNICKAIVGINSVPESDSGYDNVAKLIASYPEVDSVYLVSGKTEFIVIVKADTMREVADFVAHKLAPLKGVNSTETMFILKEYKILGEILTKEDNASERLIVTP